MSLKCLGKYIVPNNFDPLLDNEPDSVYCILFFISSKFNKSSHDALVFGDTYKHLDIK